MVARKEGGIVITFASIRNAVLSTDPFTRMDCLVQTELNSGQKVVQVFDEIKLFVDQTLDLPDLTEDAEEAFLGTLDALSGNCRTEQCYRDAPISLHSTEEEIAKLPRFLRVVQPPDVLTVH